MQRKMVRILGRVPQRILGGMTMTTEINSLTVIDNVNIQQVGATIQKITQFQAIVQKTLKEKHDFGIIPGTAKPTLLKPGAEKILMLMGLTSEYDIIEKVQDYDTGFFAFTVKCILSRNGLKITEGVGHANTREKRYVSGRSGDAYTLANTVLKMAKKRAQVDATLTVASLSEIFTQDLEDMDLDISPAPQQQQQRPQAQQGTDKATEPQCKMIYAKSKAAGMDANSVNIAIKQKYGVGSAQELTKRQASEIIEMLNQTAATLTEDAKNE
jgi:hypothetical protein